MDIEGNKIEDLSKALSRKDLRRLRLEENPGLKDDHSKEYVKFLEIIEGTYDFIEQKVKALKNLMMVAKYIDIDYDNKKLISCYAQISFFFATMKQEVD